MSIEITTTSQSGATVLALNGRLDGLTSQQLEQVVEARLAAGETRFVFDCAMLSYASSAGLRVFLSTAKRIKAVGGKVVFSSLQDSVAEIFRLSGFNHIFNSHPNLDDAIADLA